MQPARNSNRSQQIKVPAFTTPEILFGVIGLVFGILFVFVTPPMQVPDETGHFFWAYKISEGTLLQTSLHATLPQSVLAATRKVESDIPFHPEHKQTIENILASLRIPLDQSNRVDIGFMSAMLYSPILYLPAALAIALGRLLQVPPVALIYIGRLANVMVAVPLTWYAIKIMPIGKWMLFLVALTPMAVFERSSLAADCLTNAVAFLLIGVFFCYALGNTTQLRTKDLAAMLVLSVVVGLCKQSYVLLPGLYLLIPVEKIGDRVKYWLVFAGLMVGTIVPMMIWSTLVRHILIAITHLRPGASIEGQMAFIRAHPWEFALVFLRTFQIDGWDFLREFIGVLGWLDTPLPKSLVIAQLIALILTALIDGNNTLRLSIRAKSIIAAIFLASLALTTIPHYIIWTPVGAALIKGPQGRYFIPIAPLALLLFYNTALAHPRARTLLPLILPTFVCISLMVTIYTLIQRYYVPAL
jgi:uncharacterized membrane protein